MAYLVDTCLISCTVRRVTPVASAVRLSTSVTDSPKQCCCTYRQTFIIIFLEWLGILALRRVMLCWDITDSEFPVNKRYLNPTLPYKMRFVKGLSSLPSTCEKYCFQKTSWLLRAHLSKIMCLLTMYSTWNHLHPSKKKIAAQLPTLLFWVRRRTATLIWQIIVIWQLHFLDKRCYYYSFFSPF